jgi:hypothetical protein
MGHTGPEDDGDTQRLDSVSLSRDAETANALGGISLSATDRRAIRRNARATTFFNMPLFFHCTLTTAASTLAIAKALSYKNDTQVQNTLLGLELTCYFFALVAASCAHYNKIEDTQVILYFFDHHTEAGKSPRTYAGASIPSIIVFTLGCAAIATVAELKNTQEIVATLMGIIAPLITYLANTIISAILELEFLASENKLLEIYQGNFPAHYNNNQGITHYAHLKRDPYRFFYHRTTFNNQEIRDLCETNDNGTPAENKPLPGPKFGVIYNQG